MSNRLVDFRHDPLVDTDRNGETVVRVWSRSKVMAGRVFFVGEWRDVRRAECPDCDGTGNRMKLRNPPVGLNPGSCERCRGNGSYLEVIG